MATEAARITVLPESCLHDEEVQIKVYGLSSGQRVTLQSSMTDSKGVHFISYAHYVADNDGNIDVKTMDSEGGCYKGLFSMGLIGTLQPAPNEFKYIRFFKRDVENPNVIKLTVHDGFLNGTELCESSPPLASVIHQRHYMGEGVQRIPVKYGKVRGCLFLPKGPGPFPGVVDMFGTAGGLLEYRSAQLASRGIASLALAFFAYDDLPKTLEEFDIAYFEEAVEFLLKHEKIMKPNVGAVGVSKGGDLVLSLATYIPQVTAGVWINGCNANVSSSLKLHDGVLPGLEFDAAKIEIVDNGVFDCYETVKNPIDFPDMIIPIENANANFLFLVGLADRNWKSEMYCDQAIKRLKDAGKNNYEVHRYKDTGHLIEPSYSPHASALYHKLLRNPMLVGGVPKPHIIAQHQAWKTTINFIRRWVK